MTFFSVDVEMTFEDVLEGLYGISSISEVFEKWPSDVEKQELIEEFKEEE